jgi:hypothetical protein
MALPLEARELPQTPQLQVSHPLLSFVDSPAYIRSLDRDKELNRRRVFYELGLRKEGLSPIGSPTVRERAAGNIVEVKFETANSKLWSFSIEKQRAPNIAPHVPHAERQPLVDILAAYQDHVPIDAMMGDFAQDVMLAIGQSLESVDTLLQKAGMNNAPILGGAAGDYALEVDLNKLQVNPQKGYGHTDLVPVGQAAHNGMPVPCAIEVTSRSQGTRSGKKAAQAARQAYAIGKLINNDFSPKIPVFAMKATYKPVIDDEGDLVNSIWFSQIDTGNYRYDMELGKMVFIQPSLQTSP